MPILIKGGESVTDRWSLVRETADPQALPEGPVIVNLATWLEHRAALMALGDAAVWLAPADDPAALADDVFALPLIAVDFPKFSDGRGYSTARLLRERFGFRGELRAVGDVLRDQLYYLYQVGFDAFALRADQDLETALSAFRDFSDGYQLTNRRTPAFRRPEARSGAAARSS